jgi:hypothetical protein
MEGCCICLIRVEVQRRFGVIFSDDCTQFVAYYALLGPE